MNETLDTLYDRFNAKDIEAVLNCMDQNVNWPGGSPSQRISGKGAVMSHCLQQWAVIDFTLIPMGSDVLEDGRISVDVHQIVKDNSGTILDERSVKHVFTMANGLVQRMDQV